MKRKKKKIAYYLSIEQDISRILSHVEKACIYYPRNTHTRYGIAKSYIQTIDYGFK